MKAACTISAEKICPCVAHEGFAKVARLYARLHFCKSMCHRGFLWLDKLRPLLLRSAAFLKYSQLTVHGSGCMRGLRKHQRHVLLLIGSMCFTLGIAHCPEISHAWSTTEHALQSC